MKFKRLGIGRSDPTIPDSLWWFIGYTRKNGAYYSIVFGWDGLSRHYFIDLNEVDVLILNPYKLHISFNWRYLFSRQWFRGN